MIVIRWASTLIFLLCLVAFFLGARSWELATIAAALFAIAGWAWGAARPAPDTQTTAGGNPSTRAPNTGPPAAPQRTT